MKYYLAICTLLISLLLGQMANAADPDFANYSPKCNLGPYGLCGYVNFGLYDIYKKDYDEDKALEQLIPPQFESAFRFSEGLAAVKLDGKYGFIDPSGKFKIKPSFESVGSFYKGLAPFYRKDKIGFINAKGEIVLPAMFMEAISVDGQTIVGSKTPVSNRKVRGLLPSLGNNSYSRPNFPKKGAGLYHLDKGWLTEQKYIFNTFNDDNLLWAKAGKSGAWGLIQMDGRWHKKPQYKHTQSLSDGLAIVTVKQEDGKELWGAVDENGDRVIPPKFEHLSNWKNGYGIARKGERDSRTYGLFDKAGNLLGEQYFDNIKRAGVDFEGTETVFLPRVKTDGVWYSLSPEGELVADQKKADESKLGGVLSCDNFTINRTEEGLTAKDRAGKTIVDFDYFKFFSFFTGPHTTNTRHRCDAPFWIRHEGKHGFFLPEGKFFAGQFFDRTFPIFENVAGFKVDEKWGLIDSAGKVILEPTYDNIKWYGDERFLLTKEEKGYLFDKNGQQYDLADDPNYNQNFKVKLQPREEYLKCSAARLQSKGRKWGLVSDDGDIILPFKYRALSCYKTGVAWAPRDDLEKWCPIDRHGKFLSEDRCEAAIYFGNGSHVYPEPLAEDPYESSVLWALQYLNYGEGREAQPPLLLGDGYRGRIKRLMWPNPYVR